MASLATDCHFKNLWLSTLLSFYDANFLPWAHGINQVYESFALQILSLHCFGHDFKTLWSLWCPLEVRSYAWGLSEGDLYDFIWLIKSRLITTTTITTDFGRLIVFHLTKLHLHFPPLLHRELKIQPLHKNHYSYHCALFISQLSAWEN